MNTRVSLILSVGTVLLVACTWVKPVDEAKEIALVKPEVAQHCSKLMSTTVKVLDNIGIISRREKKVQEELITMAKNDAALAGGDIIVAETPAKEGRQTFGVYKCAKN